jgi:hypothetical protein
VELLGLIFQGSAVLLVLRKGWKALVEACFPAVTLGRAEVPRDDGTSLPIGPVLVRECYGPARDPLQMMVRPV